MARPNIALTETEVIEFLDNGKNLQVATIGRGLAVLIEDGDSVVNLRGVMIQGRARLVDDRNLVLRLYREVTEKYEGVRVEPEGWEAGFGVWVDKNIAVLVEPEGVATWDHTKWVR